MHANWEDAHLAVAQRLSIDIQKHAGRYRIPSDLVQQLQVRFDGDKYNVHAPRGFLDFEYGSLAPETPPTAAIRTWQMRRAPIAHTFLEEEVSKRKLLEF